MKCDLYKRLLKHKRIDPVAFVDIVDDESAFRGYRVGGARRHIGSAAL